MNRPEEDLTPQANRTNRKAKRNLLYYSGQAAEQTDEL